MIPLPFAGAQWLRNVLASRSATVRWDGREVAVGAPELIEGFAGASAFGPIQRIVLRAAGINRFLRLRRTDLATPRPDPPDPAAES